jgi:hypothetical protein
MLIYFRTLIYFCQCHSKISRKNCLQGGSSTPKRQKFTIMDCVMEEKGYHCWNIMINQSFFNHFSIID